MSSCLRSPPFGRPCRCGRTCRWPPLALALLTGGGRYRARLHLSVLDELPSLLGRLLTAGAVVAIVIALRHEQESVTAFLVNASIAIGLVVVGRVVTGHLISAGRRCRVTRAPHGPHRRRCPRRGARADPPRRTRATACRSPASSTTASDCVAESVVPQLGGLADLDARSSSPSAPTCSSSPTATSPSVSCSTSCARPSRVAATCWSCRGCTTSRCRPGRATTSARSRSTASARPTCVGRPACSSGRSTSSSPVPLLVVVAPVLGACALAVRIEGGPGVIFRQSRVGRDGAVFECLKLRSMRPANADGLGHHLVDRRRTTASARSAGSCGVPRSTSCPSCGTSSAAT